MRALLFICLLFVLPSSAIASEYPIGDLAITYDPAKWQFSRISEGDPLRSQPTQFEARCGDCRGDGVVGISVADIAREESEAVTDPAWSHNVQHSSVALGEIVIEFTTALSPCRNYVPPSMTARVAYRGRTYTFRSGVAMGCRGAFSVGSERFEELLRGLHPRA